ncbi:MAG: flagellar protein FlaG [Deltaproteobacteria bacterium]|nr:flagellar protein FlaG [Deltaproteobacteria bacterium]
MLVEPVDISGKGFNPPAQARAPTVKATPQEDKEDVKAEKAPDLSHLSEKIANVQKNLMMIHDVDLQFAVHKPTGKIMVTVTDGFTGEVIREVPPSEILDLAAKIDEMIGLIFDQKV